MTAPNINFFTKLHDPKTNRYWIVDALTSELVNGEMKTTKVGLLNLYDRTLMVRPADEIIKLLESGALVEWQAILPKQEKGFML
jgi:hypothetical protein